MAADQSRDIIATLQAKGVTIRKPESVDIGAEVSPERISGDGVVIYPGCRVYGAKTVLSAGSVLGREGPVTIEDCRLGPNVQLKGGYAAKAVFLDGANLGLGHHVREGCLLEEESSAAHCVGLKQTILFPFVTLGSLINFCDAFMAGGTSRSDHSEVGSSYIHFNYTPDQDKTTPSLFGDVPRGVMLRERPIFLGGQGGSVGPVSVGYGSVVAAGGVLRRDVAEGQLSVVGGLKAASRPFAPGGYAGVHRVVAKNVRYLASLRALREWYVVARAPFFAAQELGAAVHEGALEMIASAQKERTKRLASMVAKVEPTDDDRVRLREYVGPVCRQLVEGPLSTAPPAGLVEALARTAHTGTSYLDAIRGLSDEDVASGTAWLAGIVEELYDEVARELPTLPR